ncbi:uncharacterized protein G2W53_030396 [Senna tora]|uniref:Uncharacterized protein n=1 Tax=Senna tora TaxID=362788 RepID=A0A834WBK2_9FABA|nr:uncharacterized protein G2W53_030396 [Senna tora]
MGSLSRCSSCSSDSTDKWKVSKKEGSWRSASSTSSASPFMKKKSRCGFTSKCARLVNQQRARFYIMRRLFTVNGQREDFALATKNLLLMRFVGNQTNITPNLRLSWNINDWNLAWRAKSRANTTKSKAGKRVPSLV